MVRLTKIYTKTGDDGTTGLVGGARVQKDDLRVQAYGDVDEANAAIGLCIVAADADTRPIAQEIGRLLRSIQHDMFDLGADLATPVTPDESDPKVASMRLRIIESQTLRLERAIDHYNDPMPALTSFVLPGGTGLAASLHLARTIVRRAERWAVTLLRERRSETSAEALRYLNRLSDLLFVLARVANDHGRGDVLWKPGNSRGS